MDDFEHIRMTYKYLKQITGDFSTVIGRGPFGVVYEVTLPVHCTSMKKKISAPFNDCTVIENMTTVIVCATKAYSESWLCI